MTETTTIEITKVQATELDSIANGSYKEKLQVLIESYDDSNLSERDVERIAKDVVNDMVRHEALE
jgi:hypothetical protein